MTTATIVAAAAVLLGATLQSGLGFGLSIVAAPVLAAPAGPALVAPTLSVVGFATSGLLLVGERRELHVLWGTAARLIGWALPGMVPGALLLSAVPATGLSVLVCIAVLLAVALQARGMRAAPGGGRPVAASPGLGAAASQPPGAAASAPRAPAGLHLPSVAGFISGVMQTSTGLNGPSLVLHLVGRADARQARDTLAAVFVAANGLSVVVLAATGTFRLAPEWLLLLVAGIAGWALGRLLVPLIARRHAPLSLAVVAIGATAALVQVALAV